MAAGSAAVPAGPLARLSPWLMIAAAVVATAAFASLVPSVAAGESYRLGYAWAPGIGVNLSFYVDGLSLLFALMISGIGALVALHASAYLAGHRYYGRFFVYLFAFMLAMLGLVLADNLITLFVFWELTSVTSFLLIGLDHDDPRARRNALQALLVTGAGGLALLAGFLLLGQAGGSLELSELIERGEQVRADPLYLAILILVLAGAFTKSAQFPFHFWLPNAMAAPTPVSAYLHSATMVKAGIYLLARLHPTLGSTQVWIWTLTIFGAVTATMAAVIALRQTDLKLVLAYTTVLALGLLTMFLGSDERIGIVAAITFLIVHSLYKCALFLVIGNVDHGSGSRDANVLGGLFRAMPITALAGMVAGLSMAGFPPLLGFIGKELKYEGALAVASEPVLVAAAAVFANAIMVALAAIVALLPFVGPRKPTPHAPHEAPLAMLAGPVVLAFFGLFFGLVPPVPVLRAGAAGRRRRAGSAGGLRRSRLAGNGEALAMARHQPAAGAEHRHVRPRASGAGLPPPAAPIGGGALRCARRQRRRRLRPGDGRRRCLGQAADPADPARDPPPLPVRRVRRGGGGGRRNTRLFRRPGVAGADGGGADPGLGDRAAGASRDRAHHRRPHPPRRHLRARHRRRLRGDDLPALRRTRRRHDPASGGDPVRRHHRRG
ncbi:MAG: hypothetical protein MUD06_09735, partial [Rhodospirillales bacterium]|nr:hypothetical protein [Rhodospirillales bacterium]